MLSYELIASPAGPLAEAGDPLGIDLAALWDKVQTIVAKGEKYVDTALMVIEDPALPRVIAQVQELHKIEEAAAAKKARTPAEVMAAQVAPAQKKGVGIGLSKVVGPLDLYIKYRRNPAIGYAVVGGAVLVLVGLGFGIGWAVKPRRPKASASPGIKGAEVSGRSRRRRPKVPKC